MIQLSSLTGEAVALLDLHFDTPVGVVVHDGRFYVFDGMDGDIIHYAATSGFVVPNDGGTLQDLPDLPDLPAL